MFRSALIFAEKGLAVFPCWPQDKRPATPNGLKDATTSPEIIEHWWRSEPRYNVAIATGAISKIFVLDIDGLEAEAKLHRLEVEHDALPPSVESITPRGPGRHVYFKWPDTPVRNSASKIAAGIDVRGDGGYVLAPPSIHPSGKRYAWSADSANTFAAAPDWLLDRIADPSSGNGNWPPTPPSEWRSLMANGVDEGQRDNAATRLCGYMLRHYLDPLFVLETLQV